MKITDYTKKDAELSRLKGDLLACLGENVFCPTEELLCLFVLRCFDEPVTWVPGENTAPLAAACENFKASFNGVFNYWQDNSPVTTTPTKFHLFLFNVLAFEVLPLQMKMQLERRVRGDLEKIQKNLQLYADEKYIKEYTREAKKPTDHREKTLLDFYNRNLSEQNKIVNYYTSGLSKRAIAKAKISLGHSAFFEGFNDYPYLSAFDGTEDYFDHRKLDIIGHRLLQIDIDEGKSLRSLYASDKSNFYEELKKLYPLKDVYQQIRYLLLRLQPFADKRKPIFEELIKLFDQQDYYGFYALALCQIEGIFSEIAHKIQGRTNKGSLPDKVSALRPSYEKGMMYLDYYEYHIPIQRNKFMHLGFDEDIMVKAHDLLYDLPHLLSIYAGIEVPILKLGQLVKQRKKEPYYNEEGFVEYFQLMEKCKGKEELKELKLEIETFEKDFLAKFEFDHLADEFEVQIPDDLNSLFNHIKEYTTIHNGSGVIMDHKTLHNMQTHVKVTIEELYSSYTASPELYERVYNYAYFTDNCGMYIPNMPQTAKDRFKKIGRKFDTDFSKIKFLLPEFVAKATM